MNLKNLDQTQAVNEELENWNKIFEEQLKRAERKDEDFSSYWWEEYYSELTKYIKELLDSYSNPSILELGSGSGKASILLGQDYHRVLVDISPAALKYAQYLAARFQAHNISYICDDIFNRRIDLRQSQDFTWNIGVIEHYTQNHIVEIIRIMISYTKLGGLVALAVPNKFSGPIIKANILKSPLLSFMPGYRIGSEKFYSRRELHAMIKEAARRENREITVIKSAYFGNPLIMETPKWMLISLGKLWGLLFPCNKFLLTITFKVE